MSNPASQRQTKRFVWPLLVSLLLLMIDRPQTRTTGLSTRRSRNRARYSIFTIASIALAGIAHAGQLEFGQVRFDGVGGVNGLDGAASVTLSPDGNHIYAAGFDDDAISVFSRDASTGALSFVEVQVDGVGGVNGLDGAFSVTVSLDGNHVYAAGFNDDALTMFSTAQFAYEQFEMDGIAMADGLDLPLDVVVSPDGRHVYTAALGESAIGVFSLDELSSDLAFIEVERNNVNGVTGMASPASISMSADGRDLYVASPSQSSVVHFSRDGTTGELTFQETLTNSASGGGLAGANVVFVSPDGAHVYVGLIFENAVSVWSRHPVTGALSFVEIQSETGGIVSGLSQVQDLVVSPDGENVYAVASVNTNGSAGAMFTRNTTTGALTFLGEIQGFSGSEQAVLVSPGGQHVYVADVIGLILFDRNPLSGILTLFSTTSDGGAEDLTISGDGRLLLGVDVAADALFVRARDPATGSVILAQRESDGVTGVSGLDGASAVAITPTGAHAVVTGSVADSLALFVPEPAFGVSLCCGLSMLIVLSRRRVTPPRP